MADQQPDPIDADPSAPTKRYSLAELLKDMQPGDMPTDAEFERMPTAGDEEL